MTAPKDPGTLDLAWRVEMACGNACPSPREIVLGEHWLLRVAGGATRRTNAVSPLRAAHYDPAPIIEPVRQIYRAHGQHTVFRVPTIAPGMDAPLEKAGFIASDEVSTLLARLDAPPADPGVDIAPDPSADWLAAKFRLTPKVGAAPEIYRAMVAAIVLPKAFAALAHDGRIVSVGYGAVHDSILVLGSIVTDPSMRQHGFGRRLVAGLMAWGNNEGAQHAALQVESDNAPALALYRAAGFGTELYRYHYRAIT